jgi:hypothetical protein
VAGISTEPEAVTAASVVLAAGASLVLAAGVVAMAPGRGSGVGEAAGTSVGATFGGAAQAVTRMETISRSDRGRLRRISIMSISSS